MSLFDLAASNFCFSASILGLMRFMRALFLWTLIPKGKRAKRTTTVVPMMTTHQGRPVVSWIQFRPSTAHRTLTHVGGSMSDKATPS